MSLKAGPTLDNFYPNSWGIFPPVPYPPDPQCAVVTNNPPNTGVDAAVTFVGAHIEEENGPSAFEIFDPDTDAPDGCVWKGTDDKVPAGTPPCRSGVVLPPTAVSHDPQCVIGVRTTPGAVEGTDWSATVVYGYRTACTTIDRVPCNRSEVTSLNPTSDRPVVVSWSQSFPLSACFADPAVGSTPTCPNRGPG